MQYDSYNCGVWSCWLSNELQCFEAQTAVGNLTTWLNMRKQLIPHARTRGDVLRHMYSQARVQAALTPFHEPNPPDMSMTNLMADFAVKAASTYPSPAMDTLPGYCPDLARYLADIATIQIPGDLDSPMSEPPNFDMCTPADHEASESSPAKPTPPTEEADLHDLSSPPTETPSPEPTLPMQEADLQDHPSLPAEARSPHTPESDTNPASSRPPASIPPPLPDCQTQKFPTQSDAGPSSFTVLTWNVMGYTTVRTELQALLQMHTPDVIILTETKFIKDARLDARLKHMLTEYETYLSSSPRLAPPSDPETGTRQGCAGILVAIHKRWQPRNFVKRHLHDRMPALTGHVLDLTLETPHGLPLYICGVYMPHDLRQRRAVYEYLVSHAAHSHIVMAGDWNADPLRNSTTLDHQHSRVLAQAARLSCYSLAPAECTHYPGAQQHAPSHLDAFLVSAACRDSGSTTQTLQSSGASDHTPILLTMPSAAQVLRPPVELPKPKFEPRLRRVQTQTALLDFKDQLQLTSAAATTALQEQLELARLQPDCALPGLVDSLGTELIQLLLDQAMPLASKLLEWTQPPPEKRYAPRKLAKQRLTCLKKQWAVSACLREYREVKHGLYAVPLPPAELTVIAGRLKRSASSWTDVPLAPEHAPLDAPEGWRDVWAAWARTAQRALDGLQRESLKLEHDTDTKNAEKQRKQFQHLFATEQKKANKRLNTTGPSEPITALQDSAGHLCTTQQELLTLTHDSFAAQATAPAETTDTDALPWERPGADPFTLVAEATSPTAQPYSMGAKISDPTTFNGMVRTLAHGKVPGPDCIPNEVIKYLPEPLLGCIHLLFQLMYRSGSVAGFCKDSNMILLHKKGETTLLQSYRPITLANTLSKLYTGLLATAMHEFADHHDILSDSQEGFRPNKGTSRQLQMVVNMLSDAKLMHQDIFALYVDFSSAFNTIYHHRLWQTMALLGFDQTCIRAVKSLYQDCGTQVQLAGSATERIKVGRGTLQGDSLSPLLFIIAIEPLARWLHSGGRGYALGSSKIRLKIACNAYADDLGVFSNCPKDLAIQAAKIESFSAWAGLRVSVGKCAVSGLLHGYAYRLGGSNNPLQDRFVDMAHQRLMGVKLNGLQPNFLHPDKQTYRYLGVELSLSMNWARQVSEVVAAVKQKANKLIFSQLSPEQKLTYLRASIKPKITYPFPIGIYTPDQIEQFDKLLARCGKAAYNLPTSTATSLILDTRAAAGMGVQSLMVDYVQQIASSLTRALADEGPLGSATRDLLEAQHTQAGGQQLVNVVADQADATLARRTQHFNVLRQICILAEADVKLQGLGLDLDLTCSSLMAAAKLALASLGGKIGTSFVKYLTPMLELGCTQLKQVVYYEGDLAHMIAASQLSGKLGKDVSLRHLQAYNDLTRILTCTTRPKRARKAADIPQHERCLTLDSIKQLLGVARPEDHLTEAAAPEPDQPLTEQTRQVQPDLRKLYLKACRQARKQQSGQVQGAIPEQNPKPRKAPKPVKSRSAKARPAGNARKTRSQSKADKEVHPVKALLNMTSCRRIKKPHAHLRNITAFRNNIRACSNNAKEVIAALDDDLKIDRITA